MILKKVIKILGILFSLITVILAISIFIDKGFQQIKLSWMAVAMCCSLIFNGGASYLIKNDLRGLLSLGFGVLTLSFVILTFTF